VHRTKRFIGIVALCVAPLAAFAADALTVAGRVVAPDGKGIAQAVVFVQAPPAGARSTAGAPSAEMDQIDKTFVPGVLPVVVGTTVHFPNHDQILHHVYSFSRTKSFELPLYKGRDAPPVLFDKVGVVKVGCNIHDWMSGIILVLPTRHFSVTDDTGRFVLRDLPAGSYELAAWHASSQVKLDATVQRLAVDRNVEDLTFELALAAARPRPAVRGVRRDQ